MTPNQLALAIATAKQQSPFKQVHEQIAEVLTAAFGVDWTNLGDTVRDAAHVAVIDAVEESRDAGLSPDLLVQAALTAAEPFVVGEQS